MLAHSSKEMDRRLSQQQERKRIIKDQADGLESYFRDPRVVNHTRAEQMKTQLINEKAEHSANQMRTITASREAKVLTQRRQMIKDMFKANVDMTKTLDTASKYLQSSPYNPRKQVLIDDYLRYQHSKERKVA